ncbi:AIG2 family protein [Alkalispirillum mobile]|uniref:AIG2 family protein n=1 Tax=Alkalispirillum mobile TaxID=85925 RepID=A0A498C5I6_9GAMM|nr:gamma-glutamylcyclotransferase family protein [Alkalispirillum mobile]RLK50227.1 AIG2 family protein [Alkalispirillum mobile]
MAELIYFAYGSNLHPLRLLKRVPSSRPLGCAVLPDHALHFDKKSVTDGSGKCRIGAEPDCRVHGVLFSLRADERPYLDRAESLGVGYFLEDVQVLNAAGEQVEAFTYVANPERLDPTVQPYCWYRDIVAAGARFHGFPADYVQSIARRPVWEDPDPARRARQHELVRDCLNWRPAEA